MASRVRYCTAGPSTVYALGHPPDADEWVVGIENPEDKLGNLLGTETQKWVGSGSTPMRVSLKDEALSVSAIWGKCLNSKARCLDTF